MIVQKIVRKTISDYIQWQLVIEDTQRGEQNNPCKVPNETNFSLNEAKFTWSQSKYSLIEL